MKIHSMPLIDMPVIMWVLCGLLFMPDAGALPVNSTNESTFASSPCPCEGQPEGIVIPHPSDCRAYYTCLDGMNVRLSKCLNRDQFFHPYIRSCVQRTTFVSFVPNFVPTKDVCKITAVFPSPAMEDFGNCDIKADESANDPDSDEITSIKSSNINDGLVPTSIPTLDSILSLFTWMSNRTSEPDTTGTSTGILKPNHTRPSHNIIRPETSSIGIPSSSASANLTPTSKPENCNIVNVAVHHFPGPCRAQITCESGVSLTIDKCQSSLSLLQL